MKYKTLQIKDFKFTDTSQIIEGYASTFGNVDSYGDTIFPGAFAETIKERPRPVRMRWNHWGPVIGKWLEIKEDDQGLWVKGELTPGHSKADDVYASLKHGAIDGLSIGYWDEKSHPNETGGDDLFKIHLIEISVVEEPADIHATIDIVKSSIESMTSLKQIEKFIRDECSFSHRAAKALISQVIRCRDGSGSNHRDGDQVSHRDGDVIDLSGIDLKL